MKLVNLTAHEIVLVGADGQPALVLPPSGNLARCSTTREVVTKVAVDGHAIPVTRTTLGELTGLPDPTEGVGYVVSLVAATAAAKAGRVADVFVPDDSVRDEKGRIIGCRALARQA